MIARTVLAALAASATLWGGVTLASADASRTNAPEVAIDDEEGGNPELEAFMKDMGRSLKMLGRGIRAEDAMTTGLAEVLRLERAMVDGKELLPPNITSIEDEAERARVALGYRAEMHAMFRGLLDLEMAYAKGDADEVMEQLRALDGIKKRAHGEYKKD